MSHYRSRSSDNRSWWSRSGSPSPSRGRSTSSQPAWGPSTYIPPSPKGSDFDAFHYRRKYSDNKYDRIDNNQHDEDGINDPNFLSPHSYNYGMINDPSMIPGQPSTAPTCPFCEEENNEYKRKDRLKIHLTHYCPMLHTCRFCQRAIEVSKLNDHYLDKCPWLKDSMIPCSKCGLAIYPDEEEEHQCPCDNVDEGTQPIVRSCWCPLCQDSVIDTLLEWQKHLIGPSGCYGNLRRETCGCGPQEDPAVIKARQMALLKGRIDQIAPKKKSKKKTSAP